MHWDAYVVRYGELWLKSGKVRERLVSILINNILSSSKKQGLDVTVDKIHSRLIVRPVSSAVEGVLRRTFGITSFSPVMITKPDLENITVAALYLAKEMRHSFKVHVNRADKGFPLKSPDVASMIGRKIVDETGLVVNLTNPENIIEVDIRENRSFIFNERIPGPGGLPYGSQGKVLALFSGGIDSPVAAWMIAKRGCSVDFLFVNMSDCQVTSDVYRVYNSIRNWFIGSKMYVASIPELKSHLMRVKEGYRQIAYKRFMYRLAGLFASKAGWAALVTGDSLGQVSSQTLKSLIAVDDATKTLVLRPLVGMDKTEITNIAREIGSLDLSEKIPELCKLESHSITNISVEKARELDGVLPNPSNFVERIRVYSSSSFSQSQNTGSKGGPSGD